MSERHDVELLLVNPGGHKRIYQSLSQDLSAHEPPIWAGLIAEYVRGQGHSVAILDANVENLDAQETAEAALAANARVVAVVVYGHNPSASTQVMPAAGDVCRAIKAVAPEQLCMLLGGHVAALPERTMAEESCDFASDGEGTITSAELLEALAAGGGTELQKVRGLLYRQDGEVLRNPSAPILTDLDGLMPQMAWDLLPIERYRAHNWHCFGGLERQPYVALYTTLGCPFKCSFCCIQAPFKSGEALAGFKPQLNSYRRWAPAGIVAQIRMLAEQHGVRNIKLADELFVLDKQHVSDICDGLIGIQRELGIEFNIWAYARVDTCQDQGLLLKLRAAGVRWLALGIESASEKVREGVQKGYRKERLMESIQAIRDAGIFVLGNYIFGLPDDDLGSMQETLDFAMAVNTEYANFYSTMAYPGSALYREALEKGWELPQAWDGFSQHSRTTLPLPTRHLSGAEVLSFRDRAFTQYFDSPGFKQMFAATFGAENLAEIDRMLARPLPRNFARAPGAPARPTPAGA